MVYATQKWFSNRSSEKMILLMDKFFGQSMSATGLSEYWLGLWQAHYIEWRKVMKVPTLLLNVLSTLSLRDRKLLQEHIMDGTAAA